MKTPYQTLCQTFQNHRRDSLVQHLSHHYHWSAAQSHRIVDEYIMFLYVASRHLDRHLVPTQAIDYAWEADILQNTAQYMQTCQNLCGKMIHHAQNHYAQPHEKTASTDQNIETGFSATQSLLKQYFGQSISGQAAACGVL